MRGISELRTLSRGLGALAFLNENGLTTIADLARHLDIPRANAVRILKTLIDEGYCARIPHSRFYQVSPGVRRLASGAREVEILTFVSIKIIDALGMKLQWPVSLMTPDGMFMQVRITTDRTTSLALSRHPPGAQAMLPLTDTGIVYLAFEKPEIADHLLARVRNENPLVNHLMPVARQDELIAFAQAHGYVVTDRGYPEGAIAVPVFHLGRPIGALSARYIKAGLTRPEAVDRLLPDLRDGAREIERLYGIGLSAA